MDRFNRVTLLSIHLCSRMTTIIIIIIHQLLQSLMNYLVIRVTSCVGTVWWLSCRDQVLPAGGRGSALLTPDLPPPTPPPNKYSNRFETTDSPTN